MRRVGVGGVAYGDGRRKCQRGRDIVVPKLTRDRFAGIVQGLWGRALGYFEREQYLAPALLGFDQMTRQVPMLGVTAEQFADPAQRAEVDASGVTPIVLQWTDHLDEIREYFTRHKGSLRWWWARRGRRAVR